LIVQQDKKHRIEELVMRLARERAQTMPEYAVTLSVISGSSVLAFTRLSSSAANVITGVVRLFF
jgi:hypothetical protein